MMHLDPRSWPIRWRLTALNVGVLAATVLVLGGVFLLQLEGALIGITRDHLRDQAQLAVQSLETSRLVSFQDFRRGSPSVSLSRAAGVLVRRLSGPDTGVFIFDEDGSLVAGSEMDQDLEAWPQPTEAQLSAALTGVQNSAVVSQQSRRTLVLLLPLRAPDRSVVGVLTLAKSLELTDQVAAQLRTILAVGTITALLVAGGLGLRATRAALRPLDSVIRASRQIAAGQLEERLRLQRRDEIGELAEAFDSMLDRLAAVLNAQRRFVADAAHELRTPLTALGGMVEMLQLGADRGDQAKVRHMLDTMDREIGRLGRLVADLLTLSRLDSQQSLTQVPVELAPLVTEVAHQTELLARGQNVELQIDASPVVQGDADRLKQVLINLAANSVSFTPAGGRIEFRLDQVNGTALLAVEDTGTGIPADILPRVMDRFARGDASRARATGGAGLGLAIAREIVEAHGGTIRLESQLGVGTTAVVQLPTIRQPSPDQPPEQHPSQLSRLRG